MASYGFIIIAGAVAGLFAGHLMFRSDYCMVGMFRDLFLFRQASMLRFLILQLGLTLLLLELVRLGGGLSYGPPPLMKTANLSSVVGGCVFGFGMVLTGSCVVGCLYKTGAGNVLGLCAFIAMIVGATLYAEMAPWWKQVTQSWTLTQQVTVPATLGIPSWWLSVPLGALWLGCVAFWRRAEKLVIPARAEGYIQPWKTAVWLAVLTVVLCIFTGMPIGITTMYVKMGAWVEHLILPEHVAATAYFAGKGLNYVPPLTTQMVSGGAGPQMDAIAALQLSVILGILTGAFFSAKRIGEFHWIYRVPKIQYGFSIIGGLLVGLGARMAPGCNVWHLMGGVPFLAWNSFLFALGLLPGVWLGSRVLLSRLS
ncbi:YeeE/YedE family protein [Desulfuromonas acetoxidans]|uniref:YeeE/YedE family protein n=1 Tax=Desulfuromonas acetoxidans TaxID=891 RepID=UPI002930BAE7|nr:YeeE/YedE family protein [Desulfuromonas acetoxidans]